jgi:hypothetical protein
MHALQNGINSRLGGTFPIGVFHAQDKGAAKPPGMQLAEQSSARTADVEKTSGRGGKAGTDRHAITSGKDKQKREHPPA